MSKVRIFVGSPGDTLQERETISVVVSELSRTVAKIVDVELETVRWETHAWPDVGADAQDVINREIGSYDVFVGLMWKRFGTATRRAESGTGEEFERAYRYFSNYGRPKIMFYFRKKAFFTTEIKEWKQFSNVLKFRKQLTSFGVLFWDYEEPIDFERRFREHLTNQILQLQKATPFISVSRSPLLFVSYKREDILRVEPIYDALRAAGFTPWMDVRDILPGGQWVEEVEKAITSADFFLTFVSVNTVDPTVRSETGFSIPAEVAIARKKFDQEEATTPELRPSPRSHFIPVRLDPVMPPASISQFQWIDFFNPDGQRELIDAVRRIWNQRRCV